MTTERLVRKNIWMSKEIATWYEEQSEKTGITQSALMTMALSSYIDQQKMLKLTDIMQKMLDEDKMPK